jgi:putative peptide zinc metalloprotease protein
MGSRAGTFLDGRPVTAAALVHDGQRLRLGDTDLIVERERGLLDAGRTIAVPVGATLRVSVDGAAAQVDSAHPVPMRPRLRSGWAVKRLSADAGPRRYVLAGLRDESFLRLTERDVEMLRLLDGTRTIAQLADRVERDRGADGLRRLAELLAELVEHDLIAGVNPLPAEMRGGRVRRILRPRERTIGAAPAIVDRLYSLGGYVLFTRIALTLAAAVAAAGAMAFAQLVMRGGVRPLHVANMLPIGALAFLIGRFVLVAFHELAHALTLASFGRRARRIGVKLVAVFPYAFVDTSEAWFEPRLRRVAVAAAGPASDAVLAGLFSLLALAVGGAARDIAFQLALGSYLALLLNVNPLLERDGYHVLVDVLDEPELRRRARTDLVRRISGKPTAIAERRCVAAYGIAVLCWSAVTAAIVTATTFRAGAAFGERIGVPPWSLALTMFALAVTPAALMILRPLRTRLERTP